MVGLFNLKKWNTPKDVFYQYNSEFIFDHTVEFEWTSYDPSNNNKRRQNSNTPTNIANESPNND